MADRLKMKKVLFDLANEQEKEEFAGMELAELNNSIARLEENVTAGAKSEDVLKMVKELSRALDKTRTEYSRQAGLTIESFKEMQKEFLKGLKGLQTILETSRPKKGNQFYDDFQNNIIKLTGYSKQTSEIITNLKWNTWMGLQDSNGSPLNPAIAGFNITHPYDYIALTYSGSNITVVQYYSGGASGNLVATLTLAYSGSNIISVTRT